MRRLRLFCFFVLWLLNSPASAQSEYNYSLAEGYSIEIYGSASFHNWMVSWGQAEGIGAIYWNGDGSFDLNRLELLIDIKSCISSGGSVMDNNIYRLLQSDKYSHISFRLISSVYALPADSRPHNITLSGSLSVAGITKPLILHGNIMANPQGSITFEGSKLIDMRDFNINPPSTLFGLLKVENEISVQVKASFTKEQQ